MVPTVLLQHVQQVKMSTKHYFLRKQCVCWTNLQVTFEFLIVNHDVLSLLALELGLLQTVLQRPQFLQSHTTLFILSSTTLTKKRIPGRKKSQPLFCISLHERENYHGVFLFFSSTGIRRLRSTAGLWFHPLVFQLQLFKPALLGLGAVF